MFRTQLASTISAARHNPAPTFWAADASSTIPAPPQAYAGSLQPGRQNSWLMVRFGTKNGSDQVRRSRGWNCPTVVSVWRTQQERRSNIRNKKQFFVQERFPRGNYGCRPTCFLFAEAHAALQ